MTLLRSSGSHEEIVITYGNYPTQVISHGKEAHTFYARVQTREENHLANDNNLNNNSNPTIFKSSICHILKRDRKKKIVL